MLVPLSNVLMTAAGSWRPVFFIAAGLNILTALIALFVLRPVRQHFQHTARLSRLNGVPAKSV